MSITPLPPADFQPNMSGYSGQQPFRFFCQTVLPLVYDDTLSYYELLCKVVDYLNHVISDVATSETNIDNLKAAYDQLEDYVNVYFSELDVQEEIDTKLDKMAESGALWCAVETPVTGLVRDYTNNWLSTNMSGSTSALDASLTLVNSAAQSRSTGRNIYPVKMLSVGEPFYDSGNVVNKINGLSAVEVWRTATTSTVAYGIAVKINKCKLRYFGLAKNGYPMIDSDLTDSETGMATDSKTFNIPSGSVLIYNASKTLAGNEKEIDKYEVVTNGSLDTYITDGKLVCILLSNHMLQVWGCFAKYLHNRDVNLTNALVLPIDNNTYSVKSIIDGGVNKLQITLPRNYRVIYNGVYQLLYVSTSYSNVINLASKEIIILNLKTKSFSVVELPMQPSASPNLLDYYPSINIDEDCVILGYNDNGTFNSSYFNYEYAKNVRILSHGVDCGVYTSTNITTGVDNVCIYRYKTFNETIEGVEITHATPYIVKFLPCVLVINGLSTEPVIKTISQQADFIIPNNSQLVYDYDTTALDVMTNTQVTSSKHSLVILAKNENYSFTGALKRYYDISTNNTTQSHIYFSGDFASYGKLNFEIDNNTEICTLQLPRRLFYTDVQLETHTVDLVPAGSLPDPITFGHSTAVVLVRNFDNGSETFTVQTVSTNPSTSQGLSPQMYLNNIHGESILLCNNNHGTIFGALYEAHINLYSTNMIADILGYKRPIFRLAGYGENTLITYPSRAGATGNASNNMSIAFTLKLPQTINIVSNKWKSVQVSNYNNIFTLRNHEVLYLDLSDNQYKTILVKHTTTEDGLDTVTLDYSNIVFIAFANNYRLISEAKIESIENIYLERYLREALNNGTEVISRQGSFNTLSSPDNTLFGVFNAVQRGYKKIRVSVQFSSDNIPVCFHDSIMSAESTTSTAAVYYSEDIPVTTQENCHIRDYDWNTLESGFYIKFRNSSSGDVGSEKYSIMNLDTFLKYAKRLGYHPVIEIKESSIAPSSTSQLDAIIDVIEKYCISDVDISGYSTQTLSYLHTQNPYYNLHYISTLSNLTADVKNTLSGLVGVNKVYWDAYDSDIPNITVEIKKSLHSQSILIKAGTQNNTGLYGAALDACDIIECGNVLYPAYTLFWRAHFDDEVPSPFKYIDQYS